MSTFADAGKDILDAFSKDFPSDRTVELNFKPADNLSVAVKGVYKGETFSGTATPTFRYQPRKVEVKAELSTVDKDGKFLKIDANINDALTAGLKGEISYSGGNKGECSVGAVYKNAKFGGVTGKVVFPHHSAKYVTASLQVENAETKGFGVGGTVKVVAGEKVTVESWKSLATYKKNDLSAFVGAERKLKPEEKKDDKVVPAENQHYVLLGAGKTVESKLYAANVNYNLTTEKPSAEFLFKNTFEDKSFLKVKGNIEGNVAVSKQYLVANGNVVVGTNVDIFKKTGSFSFNVTTSF